MAVGSHPVWMPVTVGCHRGLSWDLSCLTSLSMTCRRRCIACSSSLQVTPNWGTGRYAQGQSCNPVGSAQGVGMGKQKPYKIQQGQMPSPPPEKEEPCATIQAEWWGSSSVEKDLGGLVDIRQQHGVSAKKANNILGCSSSKLRGVTIPLYSASAFVRPQLHPVLGPTV